MTLSTNGKTGRKVCPKSGWHKQHAFLPRYYHYTWFSAELTKVFILIAKDFRCFPYKSSGRSH